MPITIKKVIATEWPLTITEDEIDVVFSFSNDRHHLLRLSDKDTPEHVAQRLEELKKRILDDRFLV